MQHFRGNSGSDLRNYFWWYAGKHMGCQEPNQDCLYTEQSSYTLLSLQLDRSFNYKQYGDISKYWTMTY